MQFTDDSTTTSGALSRREFVKSSALAAGSLSLVSVIPASAFGANDRIRIGVIGCGGQGTGHVHSLVKRSADDNNQASLRYRMSISAGSLGRKGFARRWILDYRKLLERKDIDAVLIATPDHWHGKIRSMR
jgi:hypothetical protein